MNDFILNIFSRPYFLFGPILFILYLLFWILDGHFLSTKQTTSTVEEKIHTDTQNISRTLYNAYPVPYQQNSTVPEAFVLKMRVEGKITHALVTKEIFESLLVGSTVRAEYSHNRFTRKITILNVTV